MIRVREVLALALTFVGTVIGAGFASGQELLHFFVRFGDKGLWGALLAGAGFMLVGTLVFKLAYQNGIASYNEFLTYLFDRKTGRLADFWLSLYLFGGLVVMLAGCGAVFKEYLSLSGLLGVVISTIILIICLFFREKGLLAFNVALVPAIVAGSLLVVMFAGDGQGVPLNPVEGKAVSGWLVSAILYISYNMISGLVLLVKFSNIRFTDGVWGTVLGGLVLGLLAWLMTKALLNNYSVVNSLEVPMLYLAHRESTWLGFGYAVVLWLAMLTSAIVNGGVLAFRLAKDYHSYPFIVVFLLVIAAGFSNAGFSALVKTIYPLFGYLNLAVLATIVVKYISN